MFCSSCKRVDFELRNIKRRVCDNGHIFCVNCDGNCGNCVICEKKIANFIHVEFNDNIPRICYSEIQETAYNEPDAAHSNSNVSDGFKNSYSSFNEIIKELNEYENCCDKAECEKKPIVGCVQIIGHRTDNVSMTISLDETDEKEILNNFCEGAESPKSPAEEHKIFNESIRKSRSFIVQSKKSVITNKSQHSTKNSITNSRSTAFGDHDESLIVNKSSTRAVLSESQHTCLSFTTISDCYGDGDQSIAENSNSASVMQIFRNEKTIKDSETANFTSLSASRVEASPPDEKKDSKIPSSAYRAKFAPVYQCDYKFPAQMEPIEFFEPDDDGKSQEPIESDVLKLPRLPITCPSSFCGMVTTPSDFFSHITIDHPYIETIKLAPYKVVNSAFCPSGNINFVRCHQMFLLSGKLSGIGYGPFKNCLPILLLSCKFNLREIFGTSTISNQNHRKTDEVLSIWLTSVYEFPVNYSLNVWKHGRDKSEQNFIKSISTVSSCLNVKQTNLQTATSVLTLTNAEYETVRDDENMIRCQIVFN